MQRIETGPCWDAEHEGCQACRLNGPQSWEAAEAGKLRRFCYTCGHASCPSGTAHNTVDERGIYGDHAEA